ncbi:MAG: mandelate racemase/muconate lactonizing enzyme family protein [Thermodesulfobacteriota bacterium]|nr:mandelate racemase/muconate lactonizing enzyme family protein [Thermodesulfobacteriota bacterium]
MKSREYRITEMRAAVVPIKLAEPFAAGRWVLEATYNVVTAVRCNTGSYGFGYAFVFREGDGQTILSAVQGLRDVVNNRDPLDTMALHGDLRAAINFVGAGGPAMSAVGAIDLALWDLKGRLLEMPVHGLLGSSKTRIPSYASGGPYNKEPKALEREVRGYVDAGFKAIKIKLPPDVKAACQRIAACHSWVGDGVKMLYDSNQQQSVKDAVTIAKSCADHQAYWYEEPFPYWQLNRSADLRLQIPCRLALGETFYGEDPFYEAVKCQAADVLMPNLHKIGGITAWTRISGLCGLAGIPLSSHTMPEVSSHVMSATPLADMLEYMNWWEPLYEKPFAIKDSCLIISQDEPGFALRPSKIVLSALEI